MVELALEDLEFCRQFERAQAAAIAASYDAEARLVIVRLQSGATFSFPPEIAQGLCRAKAEDLAQLEITPMGDGLHWRTLDTDFSMAGLLAGVFGAERWMTALQQQGSQQAS